MNTKKLTIIGIIIIVIVLVVILLKRVIKIEFSRSDKRIPAIKVSLNQDITLTSCGAVFAHFGSADFFPSGMKIEMKNKIIYVDPIVVDNPIKADYIFITHAHQDHFSIDDIEKLAKDDTWIICPKKVAKKLGDYQVRQVIPGDVLELDGIGCEAVAAYSKGFPTHPKSNDNVGYVLTIGDERIYFSGDTDLIPEIKTLEDITVAIVPIDGGNLTMSTNDAILLVNMLNPRIAIPTHYELEKNSTALFKKMVNEETEVIILSDQK